jgi:hypothetical protein
VIRGQGKTRMQLSAQARTPSCSEPAPHLGVGRAKVGKRTSSCVKWPISLTHPSGSRSHRRLRRGPRFAGRPHSRRSNDTSAARTEHQDARRLWLNRRQRARGDAGRVGRLSVARELSAEWSANREPDEQWRRLVMCVRGFGCHESIEGQMFALDEGAGANRAMRR